ncbi:phosphonate ABC transporter ATP-binding protein [Bacillus sp. V33-4]|uniref:phosphonate ABC transporter ATP-binding protein n=1 Tax=Bacillus sp. V33-4 TaxID=2054169 RepID=UPI000C7626A1|nr:phosphonate ABC transporter ATP-binding protein [Bacillus sp. V33-4]PLR81552.1 ABC transporter ATP-binding protein [Bacillus sp. V33-4]
MQSETVIKTNQLAKSYDGKTVLSDLSLSVTRGELVAVIGPSGAGKTTLLNLLALIEDPDGGTLLIDGQAPSKIKGRKQRAKKIGVIRQQFDLVNELAVIHNTLAGKLAEWGFFKSLFSLVFPREKNLAKQALTRVGLLDKMFTRTSKLSGGEQQRVAMARLLLQKPEIILADEPVASLDPARAEDVLSMLTSLVREEQQTLVSSLHSVDYARKYFTRIIGIRKGQILFDRPASAVTDAELKSLYEIKELS